MKSSKTPLKSPSFTKQTVAWIQKASRQTSPTWLERNRAEVERNLLHPYIHLASELKSQVGPIAHGYHFPQKGIGRLKRPGGGYKGWLGYSASHPSPTRFENNPSLFFLIQADDDDGDNILVAGGLYMPSSRQTRALRLALARDTSAYEKLFRSPKFKARFGHGFCREKVSSRIPRGFDPSHPKIEWIKLQAFFVWRSYSMREYTRPDFPKLVSEDWMQILKLNRLIEKSVGFSTWSGKSTPAQAGNISETGRELEATLSELEAPRRDMDF